jgi:hypothetical protein
MNTQTPDRVIAQTTRTVMLTDRERLTADAKLYSLGGQAPRFSVTGEIIDTRKRGDARFIAGGCIHDEILTHFPDLARVVKVHLADEHGVPLHALENARYWMGLSSWGVALDDDYGRRHLETDPGGIVWAPESLANHLRVSVDEARQIRAYVVNDGNDIEALRFAVMVNLAARWQADADAALAVLTAN